MMLRDDDEDEGGHGFILVIGHARRKPRPNQASGEAAGARHDQRSRHVNIYNALHAPAMLAAQGRDRPNVHQDGASMGSELEPPKPDRGPSSDPHRPADLTDRRFMSERSAPTPRDPHSAGWTIHKAPYEESSGHEGGDPA